MKLIRIAQTYDDKRLRGLANILRDFIHEMKSVLNSVGTQRTVTDFSKEELD